MINAPISLWLFWICTVLVLAGFAVATATKRFNPATVLTREEWITAAKLAGIVVMILVILYFANGHRYDGKGFIYGRF